MDETSANQFANGPLSCVLGIATLGVAAQDKDQLIHREPGRVFIEEKR